VDKEPIQGSGLYIVTSTYISLNVSLGFDTSSVRI